MDMNTIKSRNVTLKVVLASLLFAAAHIKWTLSPFAISELNIFGLFYAFTMGTWKGLYTRKAAVSYISC